MVFPVTGPIARVVVPMPPVPVRRALDHEEQEQNLAVAAERLLWDIRWVWVAAPKGPEEVRAIVYQCFAVYCCDETYGLAHIPSGQIIDSRPDPETLQIRAEHLAQWGGLWLTTDWPHVSAMLGRLGRQNAPGQVYGIPGRS